MWLFLVRSEHVKGKKAVSEEIGNFTTNSTSGTRGKAWVCKVCWSESKTAELEGRAWQQLNVYTLEELREEVIMELWSTVWSWWTICSVRLGVREQGERSRRRWSVMLLLAVNQTSIFSWREGRPSSNVNKAWEREEGRESTSTLMFECIATARHSTCSSGRDKQDVKRADQVSNKD